MRRARGYHLLFGFSLLALGALGVWWSVFFLRSVEVERTAQLSHLRHTAVATALSLGHRDDPPALVASLPRQSALRVVRMDETMAEDGLSFRTVPRHPGFAVRITDEAVAAVDDKMRRRRIMFIGEGGLLFVLIGIGTVMLYRMVRTERRHVHRMEAFLGAVTHEMKTPLAGIKSLLQTLGAGHIPEEDEKRLLAMGLKEAERLEHLVENILVSGRLRTERQEVRAEPTALRAFLEAFRRHRERYLLGMEGTLQVSWELPDDDACVLCDPTALHTVLENLTDNAFKYGGGQPAVTVHAHEAGGRIRISVEDRGIGFAPERAEQLFVPFRRALEQESAAQHGTGLGLAIARALTRRMGGKLTAESDGPGRGARFIVELAKAPRDDRSPGATSS